MVSKLFKERLPKRTDKLLDAGCGSGVFIDEVLRWCSRNKQPLPKITGVELNPIYASSAKMKFSEYSEITIENRDFLVSEDEQYDFIIGNPPYVPITQLTEDEKCYYKPLFATARGRFDLYLLFFEKSLHCLKDDGILVFITPEKFTYVATAKPLRSLLGGFQVKEIEFLSEDAFRKVTAYPMITTIKNTQNSAATKVSFRDGTSRSIILPQSSESWQPFLNGSKNANARHRLEDVCTRISCGIATGADKIFIKKNHELPSDLRQFAFPTISGKDLLYGKEEVTTKNSMLIPYNKNGELLPFEALGALAEYLEEPRISKRLKARTCTKRKPWYAFHETPPMDILFQPKILCKDISINPSFWLDKDGLFVPRHSVYYIIPKNHSCILQILEYLRSKKAQDWLFKHCQRASNGFIRLQSTILKKLPIPPEIYAKTASTT
jgi:tRNA1(Val) A37 N6-methylase TrmN6